MSTKHDSQCLAKAGDNEPIFVLRAKDPTAPAIVRQWAEDNKEIQPKSKIDAALRLSDEMKLWRKSNIK